MMMSWSLAKSQDLFFHQTGESPTKSFWVDNLIDIEKRFPKKIYAPESLLNWNPKAENSHSNCPELHKTVKRVVSNVDHRWRARAASVYAGRTRTQDLNAFSEQNQKGGMVAISTYFSDAQLAYIASYGHFCSLLTRAKRRNEFNSQLSGLGTLWQKLGDFSASFGQSRENSLRDSGLLTFGSKQQVQALHDLASAGEEFVIAHEIAHHILRHMSTRQNLALQAELNSVLQIPTIQAELIGCTNGQIEEIQADLLALMICSGNFLSGRIRADDMRVAAINGAAQVLITIGHFNGDWISDRRDSHPGALTRLAVLLKWASLEYGSMQIRPWAKDPLETFARMSGFLALFAKSVQRGREQIPMPDLASTLVELAEFNVFLVDIEPSTPERLFSS